MMTLRLLAFVPADVPSAVAWALADLGDARGRQELLTRQSPQRLKVLREHSLIESAVSSNRIEGVTVDQDRVRPVVMGKARLRDRDEEEVPGCRDALRLIHERREDGTRHSNDPEGGGDISRRRPSETVSWRQPRPDPRNSEEAASRGSGRVSWAASRRNGRERVAGKQPLFFVVPNAAITFRLALGPNLDAEAVERRRREDRRRATAAQLIACRRMASVRLTEAVDFVSPYERLKSPMGSTRSTSKTGRPSSRQSGPTASTGRWSAEC